VFTCATFSNDVTRNGVVKLGRKIKWDQLNIENASIVMGIAMSILSSRDILGIAFEHP
jgi:hypothetical protein